MTPPNKFTKKQEAKIYEIGKRIERAREAKRLTIRGAADLTYYPRSRSGHVTEFTWRRVERGFIQTGLGHQVYRPRADTLVAIADVVGLDGYAMCKELELTPPPALAPRQSAGELEEFRREFADFQRRFDEFVRRGLL